MTVRRKFIGQPLDRVDGPLKVTGRATYAGDHRGGEPALIGVIVEATVAKGRITAIDTAAAEAVAGVRHVLTHLNAPDQMPFGEPKGSDRFSQSHALLENDRVRHFGDPVALVVADTLEIARHAAGLVAVAYEAEDAILDPVAHRERAIKPDSLDGSGDVDTDKGDFDAAFAAAAHRVNVDIHTPDQHAAAMEPHAAVAQWEDGKLTVRLSLQVLSDARKAFANTLRIDPRDVRVLSPYVGGGFGSKLGIHNEAVLAALAAKVLGRPVRVVQHRRNVFSNGPHRSRHLHELKLGADATGRIVAISHDSLAAMARDYPFAEAAASPTRASYAAPALRTRQRIVEADIPKVDSMRAPGEAVGTLAFESAVDELADACGIDPVAFRLANEPQTEPASGKPFSRRSLARCIGEGAERFGWEAARKAAPRRDGDWLVGCGMAAAIRPNFMQEAEADAVLTRDGRLTLRLDMTDIGTGTYTILTQIAADALGMQPSDITVELGDTDFAETCGSGGSFGAGSTGMAVHEACRALKDALLQRAGRIDGGWSGTNSNDLRIAGGRIVLGERMLGLETLFEDAETLDARGKARPGEAHETMAQYSYGAQFAEIGVDRVTGEIRLRRLLGVFDAGRILNAKTAHSQLMGGMVFGIGAALMEESLMDDRFGAFMNRDLAEYHIPVNRDVPALEIHMLDTFDENSNALGSRGIGELGICGAGPAIANAVRHATGVRIRKFPIHLEDLLAFLPDR